MQKPSVSKSDNQLANCSLETGAGGVAIGCGPCNRHSQHCPNKSRETVLICKPPSEVVQT